MSLQVSPLLLWSFTDHLGRNYLPLLAISTLVLYLVQYLGLPYPTLTHWAQNALCRPQGRNTSLLSELSGPWTQVGRRVDRRLSRALICLRANPSSTGLVFFTHICCRQSCEIHSACFCQNNNMWELPYDLWNKEIKIFKTLLFISYIQPEDTNDINYVAPSNLYSGTSAHR